MKQVLVFESFYSKHFQLYRLLVSKVVAEPGHDWSHCKADVLEENTSRAVFFGRFHRAAENKFELRSRGSADSLATAGGPNITRSSRRPLWK